MMEDYLPKKKEIVNFFLKKGILIESSFLDQMDDESKVLKVYDLVTNKNAEDLLVMGKDTEALLSSLQLEGINWLEMERSKVLSEKGKNDNHESLTSHLASLETAKPEKPVDENKNNRIKILFTYKEEVRKRETQDFVQYFGNRYKSISAILRGRQELANATSISRLLPKKDRENVAIIGMVSGKQTTKNGNLMITVEDLTGSINVLVNKNKGDLFKSAGRLVMDEVIGVSGVNGDKIVFANNIIWPDIPLAEIKKCDEEAYCIFLSDLHVGSSKFLHDDFNKFLKWINCELGNEAQQNIARNVKYIFIVGDMVDGCGIYPEQDKELEIPDIYEQYRECARLLKKIPPHIPLILCPGNHDAVRIAEPQPPMQKRFSAPLYELENLTMVSNPSLVNIHSSPDFAGFDVLIYHGYSFDHFVAEVDYLRNNGGYDRADLIMKFLLQRRHLAPTHTSTLYIPDVRKDFLAIEKVPDFFVSGHIHKSITANYRNVTMICGSCWQSKTAFQEKVGHNPEPSRVPIVNLKTREVKILKFGQ